MKPARKPTSRHVWALAATLVFAIGLADAAPPQRPDRARPPAPGPALSLRLPAIQKWTLSNGLPVWIVEQHDVPVVEAQLVVRTGSAADPAGAYGLASLTAAMLDEGAGERDALAIADAVDYLGADLSTGGSFDASTVRLHVPVARLKDALPLLADVALRPTFPTQELDRLRDERLTTLLQARDQPTQIANFGFSRLVFGPTHRYGTPELGTAEALRALTVDNLRQFHRAHYRPDASALIVVGDVVPDAVRPLLESAFGAWQTGAADRPPQVAPALQLTSRRLYIVDKPGAAQSEIRIGWIGVPRSTPDFYVLEVLNTILGGSFTSRLNQNLREEHGYSYGARSVFVMRGAAGPFYAAAGVQTDKTAPALGEFFKELEGMLQPVSAQELEKAKNYLALRFPQQFETTRQVAGRLAELVIYGLDERHALEYVERVRAVTADQIRAAAKRYIQPDKFAVIVVGDRQAIEKDVRALNLGPLTVLSVTELLGPA